MYKVDTRIESLSLPEQQVLRQLGQKIRQFRL
jgi:hypothetical protein